MRAWLVTVLLLLLAQALPTGSKGADKRSFKPQPPKDLKGKTGAFKPPFKPGDAEKRRKDAQARIEEVRKGRPMRGEKPPQKPEKGRDKGKGEKQKPPMPDKRKGPGKGPNKGPRGVPPKFPGAEKRKLKDKRKTPNPRGPRPGKPQRPGRTGPSPIDRFGPCQACYAVAASLDAVLSPLDMDGRKEFAPEPHCTEGVGDYSVIESPRGGSPIVQGPGLPDIMKKMKENETIKEATSDIVDRFNKDFTQICQEVFKDLGVKLPKLFEKPPKAVDDEREEMRWKSQNRRNICSKYCNRPKPQKTEL